MLISEVVAAEIAKYRKSHIPNPVGDEALAAMHRWEEMMLGQNRAAFKAVSGKLGVEVVSLAAINHREQERRSPEEKLAALLGKEDVPTRKPKKADVGAVKEGFEEARRAAAEMSFEEFEALCVKYDELHPETRQMATKVALGYVKETSGSDVKLGFERIYRHVTETMDNYDSVVKQLKSATAKLERFKRKAAEPHVRRRRGASKHNAAGARKKLDSFGVEALVKKAEATGKAREEAGKLMPMLGILTEVLLSRECPFPEETVKLLHAKVLRPEGFNFWSPKDVETMKAESACCAGTSLHMHIAVMGALLTEPGQRILMPAGSFEPLLAIPSAYGGVTEVVETGESSGFKLTAEALEAAIHKRGPGRVVAIMLTNPTNPFGSNYTRQELEAISRVARKNDITVVIDEHFAGLEHPVKGDAKATQAEAHVPFASLGREAYDSSVTIRGLTKLLANESAKFGISYSGNRELMEKVRNRVEVNDLPCFSEESAFKAMLSTDGKQIKSNARDLAVRRELLLDLIDEANEGLEEPAFGLAVEPRAGFFGCLTMTRSLSGKDGPKTNEELTSYLLAASGVETRSVQGMHIDVPGRLATRINFSEPSEEVLREAFARLAKLAKQMQQGEAPSFASASKLLEQSGGFVRGLLSKFGGGGKQHK